MFVRVHNLRAALIVVLFLAATQGAALSQLERLPDIYPEDGASEGFMEPLIAPRLPWYDDDELPAHRNADDWAWQLLPEGILYQSYFAGVKEPKLAGRWLHDDKLGWLWDSSLGARVGAVRYGSLSGDRPQGWQLDFEGAVYLRQEMQFLDVLASDFRAGVPLTFARGPFHTKLAYYHTSSHVGDEFLVANPTFQRINFVRDAIVFGMGYYVTDNLRLYGEAGWSFKTKGGAEPWELQFGADFSPRVYNGFIGTPFFAINGYLREEFNFSGNLSAQAGWQWRNPNHSHVLRTGFHYYSGPTPVFEFFDRHEELIGMGLWYDF